MRIKPASTGPPGNASTTRQLRRGVQVSKACLESNMKMTKQEPRTDAQRQAEMFNQAQRAAANQDLLFLEFVEDGLTKNELERLIVRRPATWSRYTSWLSKLP
jgi:DNA-nicking Smr family endonuclease